MDEDTVLKTAEALKPLKVRFLFLPLSGRCMTKSVNVPLYAKEANLVEASV